MNQIDLAREEMTRRGIGEAAQAVYIQSVLVGDADTVGASLDPRNELTPEQEAWFRSFFAWLFRANLKEVDGALWVLEELMKKQDKNN